jgi:hypothetical protein
MSRSTPEQIADWMGYGPGEERNTFIAVWKKYPRQYSDDAKFSTRQMRETELFVRASEPDNADIQKFSLDSMLMERWAGRKP